MIIFWDSYPGISLARSDSDMELIFCYFGGVMLSYLLFFSHFVLSFRHLLKIFLVLVSAGFHFFELRTLCEYLTMCTLRSRVLWEALGMGRESRVILKLAC